MDFFKGYGRVDCPENTTRKKCIEWKSEIVKLENRKRMYFKLLPKLE